MNITIIIIIFTFTDFPVLLLCFCFVFLFSFLFFWGFFLFSFFFVLLKIFFLLLIQRLFFSHETDKVSKLLCLFVCLFVLFLQLKSQVKYSQTHFIYLFLKRFTILFIYSCFNIILHFMLSFTFFVATHFIVNIL